MSFPRYPAYKDSGVEWLGDVPEHWEVWKLSHAFTQIGSGTTPKTDNRDYYEGGDIPWVNTGDFNDRELDECDKRITELAIVDHSALKTYPPGSLLIAMYGATIGKLAILNFAATVNQACCVFAGPSEIASKFMFYWFLGLREQIISLATGGGQPNISQDILRSLRVAIPVLLHQAQIVSFLDHQTSTIDDLIAEQKRLIELLQEKKQAVISHAVTKGLNPDAPMKESGVEWLGEVPEHWEVKRVRRIFEIKKRIVGELGFEVLSITQQGIKVRDPESNEGQVSMDYSKYQLVNTGDFAMNHMDLLTGFVDISSRLGVTSPDYRVFSVSRPLESNAEYLLYIFQMGYRQKILYAYGQGSSQLGRWRLPTEAFKNWSIPFPSREEQIFITLYLDRVTAKIVALITEQQRLIELLQERRSALISAAVTGQIDVRGLVEVGASEQ